MMINRYLRLRLQCKLFIVVALIASNLSVKGVNFMPLNPNRQIQLGLSAIDYWYRPVFANAIYMESRGWMSSSTSYPVQSNQFDSNGYPLYLTSGQTLYINPGQNSAANKTAYSGKVCLMWEGDADIRVTSGSFLSGSGISTGKLVNGIRYYNNSATNGARIEIFAINADNPPKNIRLWLNDKRDANKTLAPQDQGGTTLLLNPAFTAFFGNEAFFMYRFMDMTMTNVSTIQNWSDRRKPTDCFMTGTKNGIKVGISYETAIAMCNEQGKDMWINVPAQANEDFVKKLARLIDGQDPDGTGCTGLNPNLRCYVEFGNEMAWSFWVDYCTAQGNAEAGGAISGIRWAGRQSARVISWFRSIVGETNERFKYVEGIQTSYATNADTKLNEACVAYGPTLTPSGKPDFIGITNYFGSEIEKYALENANYADASQYTNELKKVFKEFERRTLLGTASVTGVDFTGGGINAPILNLRTKYNIPFVSYEGGCGLNTSGYNCIDLNCKIVPTASTSTRGCGYFLKDLANFCGGSTNYMNFLKQIHTNIAMKKMFEINYSLLKANGIETVTQFGDAYDINASIDYGYWGCVNDLNQTPASAYRYQFWLDWYNEYKNIRNVGDSIGSAPVFSTMGELPPARVGSAYNARINFTRGDGPITTKLISSAENLPQHLTFTPENDKIVITGTPTSNEVGTYYLFYRITDADNDPAFRVFTLKILPATKDSLFAYDDFGTTPGQLYNTSTGYGFNTNWLVYNNSTTDFLLKNDAPMSYNLFNASANNYLFSGGNKRSAGRDLKVSAFDYLINSNNTSVIGQTGTSLWVSTLINRIDASNNGKDLIRFQNFGYYYYRSNANIIVLVDDNGKFALDYKDISVTTYTRTPTSVAFNPGQNYLLVLEFRFGQLTDTVNFYVNPGNIGGSMPLTLPDASFIAPAGKEISVNKVAIYGGDSPCTNFDDLRFGDSYKAVTPYKAPSAIENELISNCFITTTNKKIVFNSYVFGGELKIYDISGNLISKEVVINTKTEIKLKQNGVYFIQYQLNGKISTYKTIVY